MLKCSFFLVLSCIILGLHFDAGCVRAEENDDFYKILRVKRDASQQEIKKAFRKLSMKFHPDRDRTPGANERFSKISAAYDVLSDEKKRRQYDMYGKDGLGHDTPSYPEHGFFNFFNSFGFGNFHGQPSTQKEKAEPTVLTLYLTLDQLYFGEFYYVSYTRSVLCIHADECLIPMQECAAPGVKLVTQRLGPGFIVQNQISDESCVDRNKGWKKNCSACPHGSTQLQTVRSSVFIDRGLPDGESITLEGLGVQSLVSDPGDVVLKTFTLPHPMFKRDGRHLYTTAYLTMTEALTGFTKTFSHINKKPFNLSRQGVTHEGEIEKVPHLGMPIHNAYDSSHETSKEYGDLFVTYRVMFPSKLSPLGVQLIKESLKNVTSWTYEDVV